jgi:hypothetical protein
MSLWVLDTDMLTLWLRGQETVAARVATTPPQQLAVAIIMDFAAIPGPQFDDWS